MITGGGGGVPGESCRTRSWSRGCWSPAWAPPVCGSLPSSGPAAAGSSGGYHCLKTREGERGREEEEREEERNKREKKRERREREEERNKRERERREREEREEGREGEKRETGERDEKERGGVNAFNVIKKHQMSQYQYDQ